MNFSENNQIRDFFICRPLPILRQDIRDNYPSERPSARPIARQQEYREPQQVRVPQVNLYNSFVNNLKFSLLTDII